MTFTAERGRLCRHGAPFVAVGVTYHPSTAGCRLWTDWSPEAVDRDLRRIAAAGLNTVRVFLYWRDLQPRPGAVDERLLGRVRAFVRMAGDHGLACVLSVCTIWMNGQRLDLPWRGGRSLWRDTEMLDEAQRYVGAVAAAVAGLPNVLAFDLGDEISNVDPAEACSLTRAEVAAWQSRLADAARAQFPGLLVTQANDVSGVLGGSPFGPDAATGLDLLAVHGWPLWSPGAIESTRSFKASQLPSFLIRYARRYGPALLDEIGGYGLAEDVLAGYLRVAAASALAAGAAGAIAWCWQDIADHTEPYDERPGERRAGLLRLDGTTKPAFSAWQDVATLGSALAGFRPDPPDVGLYLPERARAGTSSYLDAGSGMIGAFYAHLLLQRAHLRYELTADDDVDLRRFRLLVVPSVARLTLTDLARLRRYVVDGGTLYLSVADHVHGWPHELAGADPVDFSLLTDGARELLWDGHRWPLAWDTTGLRRIEVRPDGAVVLARFADGSPAVTRNRVGAGQAVVCCAPVEQLLNRPGLLDKTAWHTFYRRLAGLAGISGPQPEPDPDVEVVCGWRGDERLVLLINHGTEPVTVPGPVAPKQWALLPADSALWDRLTRGHPQPTAISSGPVPPRPR